MMTYSDHICFHISGVIRPLHISVNISPLRLNHINITYIDHISIYVQNIYFTDMIKTMLSNWLHFASYHYKNLNPWCWVNHAVSYCFLASRDVVDIMSARRVIRLARYRIGQSYPEADKKSASLQHETLSDITDQFEL